MKEITKRVINLLALAALGLLAAVIWFGYINNSYPPKIWAVLLMFDIPFAAAALIWLSWRLLSRLPRDEGTKRIIDWLALIPFGFWPVAGVWAHYAHMERPSGIWMVLVTINLPLSLASIIWLGSRTDKIGPLRWWYYNFGMFPLGRFMTGLGLAAILLLIKAPWR